MRIARGRAPAPSEQRGRRSPGASGPTRCCDGERGSRQRRLLRARRRTHWHPHAIDQVLVVAHGAGYVRTRDGNGERVGAGDVVHIAAGEERLARHQPGQLPASTSRSHSVPRRGSNRWSDADYAEEANGA